MPARGDLATSFADVCREAVALLLGSACAACGSPGRPLCDLCCRELEVPVLHRCTPGGLRVVAGLEYRGTAARLIRRVKEDGQTVLARPLGLVVRRAVEAFGEEEHPLVPVPTTRAALRRRGYRVPDLLIRRAGLPVSSLLRWTRPVLDQRELGRHARRTNVHGALAVRRRVDLPDRDVLLVDDVVTSGATLDEAARALAAVGVRVGGAVTLAATPMDRQ